MIKIYPLEWLDTLILQTLTPENKNITSISDQDLSLITSDILKESKNLQIQIKNEVFSMRKKRQIRLLVRRYHSSFIYLMDNIVENQKNELFKARNLSKISEILIKSLEELLSFVETRFSSFLSLDERVPVTYILVSRKELKLKISKLKTRVITSSLDKSTLEIVLNNLDQLLQANKSFKSTYRQLLYQKELLKKIEELDLSQQRMGFYSVFDELLIVYNFNSLDYMHHFCDKITDNLEKVSALQERMSELLLYFKEFSQLHSSERVSFDPCQKNIKECLFEWFKHEINYLKKKIELSFDGSISEITPRSAEKHEVLQNKIECVLSTDQIGIILRAGDESRILKARSMSQVFKTIVPHLSTSQKKDLSYESMRSKSYTVEERDKEIAIKTLERIIKHIREY